MEVAMQRQRGNVSPQAAAGWPASERGLSDTEILSELAIKAIALGTVPFGKGEIMRLQIVFLHESR
jgi:hypothetical protein